MTKTGRDLPDGPMAKTVSYGENKKVDTGPVEGEGKEERRSDGSGDLLLQMNGQCCTWTPFYGRGDALGRSEKCCDTT